MRQRNANSQCANRRTRGSVELRAVPRMFAVNGYLSFPECKSAVPVGRQSNARGPDLQPRIVANHHRNIHLLARCVIHRDACRRAPRIVEREQVSASTPAFQRYHRFLSIGIVAEDNETADIAIRGELRRANGGSRIRVLPSAFHQQGCARRQRMIHCGGHRRGATAGLGKPNRERERVAVIREKFEMRLGANRARIYQHEGSLPTIAARNLRDGAPIRSDVRQRRNGRESVAGIF